MAKNIHTNPSSNWIYMRLLVGFEIRAVLSLLCDCLGDAIGPEYNNPAGVVEAFLDLPCPLI
jgi:hypothetical protein